MGKKLLLWVVLPVLILGLAALTEYLLPNSYTVKLDDVSGLVYDTKDGTYFYYYLEGFDGSMDDLYDEDGEWIEYIPQLSFTTDGDASRIILTSYGAGECGMTFYTPEGEEEYVTLGSGTNTVSFNVGGQSGTFTMVFEDQAREIKRIQVGNNTFNTVRFVFFFAIYVMVYLLVVLRKVIARHIEFGFLIVALILCLMLMVLMPLYNYGFWWDGDIHYNNARNFVEIARLVEDGGSLQQVLCQIKLQDANYFVQEVTQLIGYLCQMPEDVICMMDRVVNMLLYVLVCFFAIRLVERYKVAFTITALFPMPLFMSISYSYDVRINAFGFLAIALILSEFLVPQRRLSAKRAAWILISVIIASLPKVVYFPIALLLLFLPKQKFADKKQAIFFKAGVVVICVVLLWAYVAPMMSDIETYTDTRGGETSAKGQLSYILEDIPRYVGLLITNFYNNFQTHFMISARTSYAYLGTATNSLSLISFALMLFFYFTDHDEKVKAAQLRPSTKGWIAVLSAAVIALTYTVLYVAFNEYGKTFISGVQGRYFLPLFPLFAVLLQPRNLLNRMSREKYHLFALLSSAAVNVIMIYTLIIDAFHL